MLSLIRSGLLRMIAFVMVFLPVWIVVAHIWALSPHQSHKTVMLVISFVKPTPSTDQSAQSPRQPIQLADQSVQSSRQPIQSADQSVQPSSQPVQSHEPSSVSGTAVLGGSSLSPDLMNQVLSLAGSPAAGTGQALYDLSREYRIDDAYALAVFEKESSFGKYGAASQNHALGNIVCAGYPTCNGRFRWYPSWSAGYADFYRLISQEYVARGLSTVETITPVYAPSSENDTRLYIQQVRQSMLAFLQAQSLMK